jgi:hypothetical protein
MYSSYEPMNHFVRYIRLIAIVAIVCSASASAQNGGAERDTAQRVLLQWKTGGGALILTVAQGMQRDTAGLGYVPLDVVSRGIKLNPRALGAYLPPDTVSADRQVFVLRYQKNGMLRADFLPEPMDTNHVRKVTAIAAATNTLQGVQFRGVLDSFGGLTSFFLDRRIKNLTTFALQLPPGPVKVDDIWPLDVNLLSVGTGVVVDSGWYNRHARLVAIEKTDDGRPVAIIDYVVAEDIVGREVKKGDSIAVDHLAMGCIGRGEFLINEGRWNRLVLRMMTQSSAQLKGAEDQVVVIKSLNYIPGEMLAKE